MNRFLYFCLLLFVAVFCCVTPAFGQDPPPGTDVYLAPLSFENGSITVGQPLNITSRPGYDNQPFFDFNESFILYTSADAMGATDIYRYHIENGTITQVTQTAESEYSPTITNGGRSFSSVRVEADSTQRLWEFDMDGADPRLVLSAVDSVGYHTWVDENTLGLFVLGEPYTLRIADRQNDTDRIVAFDIGRCLHTMPGSNEVGFVQVESEDEAWISCFDPASGKSRRLVTTLPKGQDFAWTPKGDLLMSDGSALFVWTDGGEWEEVDQFQRYGLTNITRLSVSAGGKWLALVADDRAVDGEKAEIAKVIETSIKWCFPDKSLERLYGSVVNDSTFFMFQPDSRTTIDGFDAFRDFSERVFMVDECQPKGSTIKDLKIVLSTTGDVAWFSCLLDDWGEWAGEPWDWNDIRWTGVLQKTGGRWMIMQQHMSTAEDAAKAAALKEIKKDD